MKTLLIDKNGFGICSLFSEDSTQNELIEQSDMSGKYLDELNISFSKGDTLTVKTPSNRFANTYSLLYIRVYDIEGDVYKCEFI